MSVIPPDLANPFFPFHTHTHTLCPFLSFISIPLIQRKINITTGCHSTTHHGIRKPRDKPLRDNGGLHTSRSQGRHCLCSRTQLRARHYMDRQGRDVLAAGSPTGCTQGHTRKHPDLRIQCRCVLQRERPNNQQSLHKSARGGSRHEPHASQKKPRDIQEPYHMGSDAAAWGVIVQAMAAALIPRRFFDSEPVLLKTLRKDNETLVNINSHFLDIYQRFEVHMVRENQKTDVKGKKFFVVDSHSAGPPLPGVTYYGIEANHVDMCKFESINSPGFRNIAITLQQWIERAPFLIQERWLAAEEEGRNRALAKVNEIMSPFAAQMYAQGAMLPAYDYNGNGSNAVPRIHSARYSEASLNPGFSYWMANFPINTNSNSSIGPSPGYPQYIQSHKRALITDGPLSSSLPNSFASNTGVWPPFATVGGYASQPTSPRSEMSVPYTSTTPWPSQAPSIAATEPLTWHHVTPVSNVPLGHQAWPPRQTGPWNFYDIAYAPRQQMPPETVHVSKIESLPPENQDIRQEGMESHPADYCQP